MAATVKYCNTVIRFVLYTTHNIVVNRELYTNIQIYHWMSNKIQIQKYVSNFIRPFFKMCVSVYYVNVMLPCICICLFWCSVYYFDYNLITTFIFCFSLFAPSIVLIFGILCVYNTIERRIWMLQAIRYNGSKERGLCLHILFFSLDWRERDGIIKFYCENVD